MSENAIDPYLEAESALDGVSFTPDAQFGGSYPEYAQAYATLALAKEQHTANLIALYSIDDLTEVPYGLVLKQIKERLGLS